MPDEVAILSVHPHVIVLVKRVWKGALLGLGLLVLLPLLPLTGSISQVRWFAEPVVLLLLLIYLDVRYIQWRSESYTITDRRVILKRGVVGKFTRSVSLDRVQDVTVSQGPLGRALGFGTIEVESAGRDSTEVLDHVPQPSAFRNALYERVHPAYGATPGPTV